MSRREQLLQRLADEVRAGQRATDAVDEAVTEVMGINRTDGKILDILDHFGRMSAGDLARHSHLTTGAVTAVIDRLERAGYVQRVADPGDRRRVLVDVTDKTRTLTLELMALPLAEATRPLIRRYTNEQLELLIDFTRTGRELQERHAEWLRQRLRDS
jgi:DNA-binding MarR family transcriptional regulator